MNMTLADVRQSELPESIGLCQADLPRIARAVNTATRRLLFAGGETGFWGCWQRVAYNVDRSNPYITLPRQFARMINLGVCQQGIRIYNQFYEIMPGGPGLQNDPNCCRDWCGTTTGYERQNVPTMVDISPANQLVKAYITDTRDVNLRMIITGLDQNGHRIYTTMGSNNVNGLVLQFADPSVISGFIVTQIDAVQKDITYGDVILVQADSITGAEVTLARYGPTEINPSYRRYVITNLCQICCQQEIDTGTVSMTGVAKLEYVPVSQDTDQLLISNLDALMEECQAVRYSTMDSPNASVLEIKHHRTAIRMLQNEQRHYEGEQEMSATVNSFAGMGLIQQGIGYLT